MRSAANQGTSRRLAGQQARANGDAFEARLDRIHAGYVARGAVVFRLGPPSRSVKIGARVLLQPIDDAPPDYLAISEGVSYLFDAKSSETERWPFGKLKLHQAQHLDLAARAGRGRVVCGVVLALSRGLTVHWLPWSKLGPLWWRWQATERARAGEGYLDEEACRKIGRECPGGDWLAVARLGIGGEA